MPREGVSVTRPPGGSARPLASIVIVAYGQRAMTEVCLAALERALGDRLGREFELVLVDNASPDDTLALFDRWRDRAVVVTIDHNANFAGGNNEGVAAANGDVIVFMNNDVEVAPGAVEGLVATAREPGVGVVGMRLLYPDGTLQHGGVGFFVNGGPPQPWHLFHHQPGDLPYTASPLDLDVVTAAMVAIPRHVFDGLGGFDECYVNGWEDSDFCLRARVGGLRVVYRGDLVSVHHEGKTRGTKEPDHNNARTFFGRWGAMLAPDTELVRDLFDAAFVAPTLSPDDDPEGSLLSVEGQLTGLAPEADEARALLWALEEAGLCPAARDVPFAFLAPLLDTDEDRRVLLARARYRHPDALSVHVPVGERLLPYAEGARVLRLAGVPADGLPDGVPVWAASPKAVDDLVAAGLARDRVKWVPPVIPPAREGIGGQGVLATVGAHAPDAARGALSAIARLAPDRVRIVPTAASPALADLVREVLPGAELLGPCSSERRFAALAATADAVVCADPSDRFDRRALVAAAAGAAPVTLGRGAARAILGDTGDLEAALADAAPSARRRRAQLVRSACDGATALELVAPALVA